jgi:integrase
VAGCLSDRFVQLLILTGARRDEIGSMRWSEFDLAAKVWTLPKDPFHLIDSAVSSIPDERRQLSIGRTVPGPSRLRRKK